MSARILRPIAGPHRPKQSGHIEVPRVAYEKLSDGRFGEPSECIRERIERAREVQWQRFARGSPATEPSHHQPVTCNSDMRPTDVRQYCVLDDTGRSLIRTARASLRTASVPFSARAYHRVLKLARTIAVLVGAEQISLAISPGVEEMAGIWRRRCNTGRGRKRYNRIGREAGG